MGVTPFRVLTALLRADYSVYMGYLKLYLPITYSLSPPGPLSKVASVLGGSLGFLKRVLKSIRDARF